MKFSNIKKVCSAYHRGPTVVLIALLLCNSQLSFAQSVGTILGAAAGAITGGIAGAQVGAEVGAKAASGNSTVQIEGSSGSVSSSILIGGSSGGSGSSSANSGGSSLSTSNSISSQSSASLSLGSGSSQASASALVSIGSTTAKPEGLLSKVKEIVKSSVESLTKDVIKDDKKDEKKLSAEASISASPSGIQASGGASISGGSSSSSSSAASFASSSSSSPSSSLSASSLSSIHGSSGSSLSSIYGSSGSSLSSIYGSSGSSLSSIHGSSGSQSASASAQISMGSTPKPESLIDKLSDMAKRNKEATKETRENRDDTKLVFKSDNDSGNGSIDMNGSVQIGSGNKKESENPIEKVQKLVNKGTEAVRDTVHKIEDRAIEVTEKVSKTLDENIIKPMSSVSGSGQQVPEGRMTLQAASAQVRPTEKDKHLIEIKKKQESELGQRPSSLKEIILEAKANGVIPQNEDRSALRGNHADEKSVTVEVLDKMHEISKIPVESMLKPIDKALGYEKDPLIRMYDNSHELIRRPISLVSKPVESIFTGAFKTTDEAKRENEKLLHTTSEQERREAKLKEEKARQENRSVVGDIADKTIELYEKPFEIILKPVDHVLGFDKDGKKNPLLRIFDEVYGLSKKPIDAIAKPFESILRKMADGDQAYQVSVRYSQTQVGDSDPKLFTRLADGALNIADRVITKPLEIVMKPLNHALGYDEPGKKNPIVDAAHSLKNATKVGVELFTKPIDRIIKEIAEIGAIRDEAERQAELERQRQEASRIVKALDKIHEVAQAPWEIVLRPVGRALGYSKEGRKEPLLRAWDVIHQVVRTPIQVLSKPVEDALLGEQPRRPQPQRVTFRAELSGNSGIEASIGGQIGPSKPSASISSRNEEKRKNFIVEGIKKVERFATKPFDVITSPIRKLILGEDDEKVGSELEKNNRAIQARAQAGSSNNQVQVKIGSGNNQKQPDKIIKTLEQMNNVVLKPLEVITQPISDIITSDGPKEQQQQQGQKKVDVQVQGQVSQQQNKILASAQAQIRR